MKKLILITCLLLLTVAVNAQQNDFPKLTGPYLGQKPPGNTPVHFAPEIFNPDRYRGYHSVIVFSPDGKEAIFQAFKVGEVREDFFVLKQINSQWTGPHVFPFLGGRGDSPAISPDGKKLFFLSTEPISGTEGRREKENIWVSERIGDQWSEPNPLPLTVNSLAKHWQISLDKMGNLYLGVWKVGATGGTLWHDIFVARSIGGRFAAPEKLGPEINNPDTRQFSPYISPEGDFLLFTRTMKRSPFKTTIHLSFLNMEGRWMPPLNISEILKIEGDNARVTPDGKYMFFMGSQGREVFWMDAGFIEELRPKK